MCLGIEMPKITEVTCIHIATLWRLHNTIIIIITILNSLSVALPRCVEHVCSLLVLFSLVGQRVSEQSVGYSKLSQLVSIRATHTERNLMSQVTGHKRDTSARGQMTGGLELCRTDR